MHASKHATFLFDRAGFVRDSSMSRAMPRSVRPSSLLWMLGASAAAAVATAAIHPAAAEAPVRVMLLPHTHDDPGWTASIAEYYEGGYEYK